MSDEELDYKKFISELEEKLAKAKNPRNKMMITFAISVAELARSMTLKEIK